MCIAPRSGPAALAAALVLGLALLFLPAGCAQDEPPEEEETTAGGKLDTQAPQPLADPSTFQVSPGGSQDVELTGSDDVDPESGLFVRVTKPPGLGSISAQEGSAPLIVTYTANDGASGLDDFTYEVSDASGNTRDGTVGIGVGISPD